MSSWGATSSTQSWLRLPSEPISDSDQVITAKLKIDNKIILGRSWKKHLRDNNIETLLLQGTYLNSGRIYPIINRLLYSPNWKLVFSGDAMVFTKIDTPITQVPSHDAWQAILSRLDYIQRMGTLSTEVILPQHQE